MLEPGLARSDRSGEELRGSERSLWGWDTLEDSGLKYWDVREKRCLKQTLLFTIHDVVPLDAFRWPWSWSRWSEGTSLSCSRTASLTWPSPSWCSRNLRPLNSHSSGKGMGTEKDQAPGGFSSFWLFPRDNIYFSIWDCWSVFGHEDFTLSDFINAVRVRCRSILLRCSLFPGGPMRLLWCLLCFFAIHLLSIHVFFLQEKYGIEPTMVVHGVKMLYVPVMPGHSKRLKLT